MRDGQLRYYGSADSTSWFLVVLAALDDASLTAELEDAWRAAGGWLERALGCGDGLVTYGPRTFPGGLVQQGWRDTIDPLAEHHAGILRPDGTIPEAPLADADTQAAALVALRALHQLSGEERWAARASEMAQRVADAFTPDTMAIEVIPFEDPQLPLPFHMVAIRDMGLTLGEMFDLDQLAEDCARDGVYEFLFCAPPLKITGAVGSPLNPLAVK